jgi:hypothetical protein
MLFVVDSRQPQVSMPLFLMGTFHAARFHICTQPLTRGGPFPRTERNGVLLPMRGGSMTSLALVVRVPRTPALRRQLLTVSQAPLRRSHVEHRKLPAGVVLAAGKVLRQERVHRRLRSKVLVCTAFHTQLNLHCFTYSAPWLVFGIVQSHRKAINESKINM